MGVVITTRIVAISCPRTLVDNALGLAIVPQLVELHAGTIEVTSTVPHGSTFTMHLPLGAAEPLP